jgi:serine/threonine-protein kinase
VKIGDLINRVYLIEARIGEGGFGTVWKAVDQKRGDKVAIKELRSKWANSEEMVSRFRNEYRALERLNHKNIIHPIDYHQMNGQYLIVMECLRGGSLFDRLRQQSPLDTDTALSILKKMLNVLELTNKKRIIHRDIKPSNILFADKSFQYPKLGDFGLTYLAAELLAPSSKKTPSRSLGTLTYMSPEQLNGESVSIRSDIYSLGLTLYKMLTGRLFFNERVLSAEQIKRAIYHSFREHPGRYRPDLPFWIDELVMKMIDRDPSERIKSPEEALEIIQKNSVN